jgi:NADPH:quinone reductase-like Zn-dependent oxidoreductase
VPSWQRTDLLDQGKCQAVVDSSHELEQFKEPFKQLEEGHAKGRVVLKIAS